MSIYYIDRKTGEKKEEKIAGEAYLKWIYENPLGMSFLELFIKKKIFSSIYGKLQNTKFSSKKIDKFINELGIDLDEAEKSNPVEYKSFNEFFSRKLKPGARPIVSDKNVIISPADGRLMAYQNIDKNGIIQVKGSYFNLYELFNNKDLALEYDKGTCIIVRLCPSDYHRFHFPDSGLPKKTKKVKGYYYSVNPISLKKIPKVYCQNKREFTEFHSDNFGKIILMEIGATCVGSIVQTYDYDKYVYKGNEKGYFKFGGSTVIIFLKANIVQIDKDILENTKNGYETLVSMGEGIGKCL